MGRELETASRSECIHGSPPTAAAAALANHSHLRWHRLPLLPTQCLSPPHSSLGRRRHKSCPNTIRALGRRCRAMPHREYRRCQPRAVPSSLRPSVGRADVTNSRSGPSFFATTFCYTSKTRIVPIPDPERRSSLFIHRASERGENHARARPIIGFLPSPPFASLDNRRVSHTQTKDADAGSPSLHLFKKLTRPQW